MVSNNKKIIGLIGQTELPAFAVFDFDNTCISNDITEATLAYMASNNLFKDKNLLGGKFKNLNDDLYSKSIFKNYYNLLKENKTKEAYKFISKILSNYSVDEIGLLASKVVKATKKLKPKKQIIELINLLKKNGIEVWIVSASIEPLVEETMKYFNINAKLLGVRNVITKDKITAKLEKPIPMFEGKVACIKKFINSKKIPDLGVGDSLNDLPMLEYCKIKAIVGKKSSLIRKGEKNNWFMYNI